MPKQTILVGDVRERLKDLPAWEQEKLTGILLDAMTREDV